MITDKELYKYFKSGNGTEAHATIKEIMEGAVVEPKLLYSPLAINQYTLDLERLASYLLQGRPVRYRKITGEFFAEFIIDGKKEYFNLSQILKFCNRQHVKMGVLEIAAYEKQAENPDPNIPLLFKNQTPMSREDLTEMAAKELKSLSYAELLAMRQWTSGDYTSINDTLRGNFAAIHPDDISKGIIHTVMALSGLNKAPKRRLGNKVEDENLMTFVYRWEKAETPLQLAKLKQRILNAREGEVILTEACLLSSSYDQPVDEFAGNVAIIFEGEYSGVDIRTISAVPEERECLVLPTQLKITGYVEHEGTHFFTARVVNALNSMPVEARTFAKNIHQNELMRARFSIRRMQEQFIALEREKEFSEILARVPKVSNAYMELAMLAKNFLYDAVTEPSVKFTILEEKVNAIVKQFRELVEDEKNLTEKLEYIEERFKKIFIEHLDKKSLLEIEEMHKTYQERTGKVDKKMHDEKTISENLELNKERFKNAVSRMNAYFNNPQQLEIAKIKEKMLPNTLLIVQKGDGFVLLHKGLIACDEIPISIDKGNLKLAKNSVPIENLFEIDDLFRSYSNEVDAVLMDFAEFKDKDPNVPEVPSQNDTFPLMEAVRDNKIGAMLALLFQGARLDITDPQGNTVPMLALRQTYALNEAGKKLFEFCSPQLLLQKNADGENLFFIASTYINIDLLNLLEHRFSKEQLRSYVNEKNSLDISPLLRGIKSMRLNLNIKDLNYFNKLIELGADIKPVVDWHNTQVQNFLPRFVKGMDDYFKKYSKFMPKDDGSKLIKEDLPIFKIALEKLIVGAQLSNIEILTMLNDEIMKFKKQFSAKYPASLKQIDNLFYEIIGSLPKLVEKTNFINKLQDKYNAIVQSPADHSPVEKKAIPILFTGETKSEEPTDTQQGHKKKYSPKGNKKER